MSREPGAAVSYQTEHPTFKGYLEDHEVLDDEAVSLKLEELRENRLER